MYERILVPVDGSPTSNRGLDEAIKLARLTKAKMRLVHVVDEYIYYGGMDGIGVLSGDLIVQLELAGKAILEDTRGRAAAAGLTVGAEEDAAADAAFWAVAVGTDRASATAATAA